MLMIFMNAKSKLFFFLIQKGFLNFLGFNLSYFIQGKKSNSLEIEAWSCPWNIYPVLTFCKKHSLCQANSLIDIVVSDNPKNYHRFIVRYLLLSVRFNFRLSVVTKIKELATLISITSLFGSANWIEREIFDLFGIFFLLHTDLRRILTEYGFQFHPLRKDFPMTGFFEVVYDDSQKRIVQRKVELSQEYRYFDFTTHWIDE